MWELGKQNVNGWVEAGPGLSEWTSTTSEFSVNTALRSSRGHIRRAMLTIWTLMSLLYTSPRIKKKHKRRFLCLTGAGVPLFLLTFGVCPILF